MPAPMFPHHHWSDTDGLTEPDPTLAAKGYFRNDPDTYSDALRDCHELLWNRRLPDGTGLNLQRQGRGLLDTDSGLYLSSDAAVPAWERWGEIQSFNAEAEHLLHDDRGETIHDMGWRLYDMGGFVLFPGFQVGNLWTINQAKGCTRQRIADRLDLTLECVRLYYAVMPQYGPGEALPSEYNRINPLGSVLHRYRSFFEIFGSFDRFVAFWLLEDLITDTPAGPQVRFLLRGRGFDGDYDFVKERALPADAESYLDYLRAADDFVERRNRRMAALASKRGLERVCPACLGDGESQHERWTL